jgi:hypothetical protein
MVFDKMAFLTEPDTLARERVDTPEWPKLPVVWVRTMTGTERNAVEVAVRDKRGMGNYQALMLVRCLCDENGERLFADVDAVALGRKNALVLQRLLEVAMRVNGMDAASQEEMEKNSETPQSE